MKAGGGDSLACWATVSLSRGTLPLSQTPSRCIIPRFFPDTPQPAHTGPRSRHLTEVKASGSFHFLTPEIGQLTALLPAGRCLFSAHSAAKQPTCDSASDASLLSVSDTRRSLWAGSVALRCKIAAAGAQWPRGQAKVWIAWTLRSWVRIPFKAWMFVLYFCVVVSCLWDGPIQRRPTKCLNILRNLWGGHGPYEESRATDDYDSV
jgi:hypothetical protein